MSGVQRREFSIQGSESSVQSPASRVQRPEPSVESPASRVQRPESNVQLLRPESRNSGMPKGRATPKGINLEKVVNFDLKI